ncbi:iron uptake porin [Leptolyngbya sp. GGD]|uniref:iron uptake porin n=1 Tax=Leptolyngbya sp. GGD TaxID=2997907 RepID=UPI00227C176F|nr:iron uptake porin [Leptolyngbya sp. GGD]MCY6488812.1 iron uptake porin [Leptolyngbya sp. GGD]
MLKISWNSRFSWSLFLSTGILLASTSHATKAAASEVTPLPIEQTRSNLPTPSVSQIEQSLDSTVQPINRLSNQVTSVSQLSDVRPTDWAFQALQSLVERYGCIAGYPDRTYRGNRALTRYEFAAGLNACLDRVNELIAAATADLVKKEDLTTLQKLQEQFATELATLRGRVDKLEARTTTLEKQQFSTTTKLQGDAIFIAADTFGDRANNTAANDTKDDTQAFFAYRVRLSLLTSFTGKDLLFTRLAANNVPNLQTSTGTAETRLTIDRGSFPESSLYLDSLHYRFPLGNQTTVWVGTRQLQPVVFAPNLNPLIGGANGAISRFATHNPTIYRPGFDGAGVGVSHQFSPQLRFGLGYLTDDTQAPNPNAGRGIFSGNNLLYSQLTFTPSRNFDVAFSYGRKYFGSNTGFNLTGGTGSAFARNPFQQNATVSDNFGLQFLWKTSPTLQIGGWFGYTRAFQVKGADNEATILNGAISVAFPDLFKKGNLGGIIVGIPPKATSNNFRPTPTAARRVDSDTSLHLEAFYTFKVNNNVSITPGVFLITNPEQNRNNDSILVGTVRTNFSF